MKKKIHLLVFILFILPLLSGCWNNKDINQRIMPIAMGVSMEEEDYHVFLKIPQENNYSTTRIISSIGSSINSAIDQLSANMESNIDLFHIKVIVIDEELANSGINNIVTTFMRSREISAKSMVIMIKEDMEDFMNKTNAKENEEEILLLNYFGQTKGWNPHIAFTRLWEIYQSLHSNTKDVAIPIVSSGKTTILQQMGSAILKSGKKVGEITTDDTLLYNIFKGLGPKGNIEVMDHASAMIIGAKVKNKAKMNNNLPFFESTVKLKVMILETKGKTTEQQIKNEMEELLTDRYKKMMEQIMKDESDILGLGQYYQGKLSESDLTKWREIYYPNMRYDFHFNIDIQNVGHIKMEST
ncbi:Ger(x)C family spore germination protein [Clostridium sp. UBA1652]|uniref:Ger(x)C family spore germination protein n=1 Tax=Clostridium sp. UBA1652 TaxID=1946348 RepID=UPI002580A725|nr:Ger(x)C family spore germination protein [Clostridium sp. UBA1652]